MSSAETRLMNNYNKLKRKAEQAKRLFNIHYEYEEAKRRYLLSQWPAKLQEMEVKLKRAREKNAKTELIIESDKVEETSNVVIAEVVKDDKPVVFCDQELRNEVFDEIRCKEYCSCITHALGVDPNNEMARRAITAVHNEKIKSASEATRGIEILQLRLKDAIPPSEVKRLEGLCIALTYCKNIHLALVPFDVNTSIKKTALKRVLGELEAEDVLLAKKSCILGNQITQLCLEARNKEVVKRALTQVVLDNTNLSKEEIQSILTCEPKVWKVGLDL